ncbi:MAG TPA: hypothetical protein VFF98_09925, partial [Novosphingobium sp.]|nr:hypothetical protein [Novosphingobium sp.]
RTVVALALRDPLWSVPRPRRWFRPGPPRAERLQLANPRLESLRRFVILRRHGQDSGDGATTLLNCGFSPGQIREAGRLADLHSGA